VPRKKKLVDKAIKKKADKKCKFCGADEYCILDLHRIVPGEKGGEYTPLNTVTCCSNCHRKVHEGKIKVDRMYYSTMGWILHYFDESGKEHWD
jgi:hypothetical protein